MVTKSDRKSGAGGVSACMQRPNEGRKGLLRALRAVVCLPFLVVMIFTRLCFSVGCHGSGASRHRTTASS